MDVLSEAKNNTENNMQGLGWAIFIIIGLAYFGGIGGGLALLSALIGLICTLATCPKGERKGQVWFFIVLMIIPIFVEALFFVLAMLLS